MTHLKGIALIVLGSMCWGATGPMIDIVFRLTGWTSAINSWSPNPTVRTMVGIL